MLVCQLHCSSLRRENLSAVIRAALKQHVDWLKPNLNLITRCCCRWTAVRRWMNGMLLNSHLKFRRGNCARNIFLRTHFVYLVKARFTLHLIILCSFRSNNKACRKKTHFFHRHRGIRRQKKQPRREISFNYVFKRLLARRSFQDFVPRCWWVVFRRTRILDSLVLVCGAQTSCLSMLLCGRDSFRVKEKSFVAESDSLEGWRRFWVIEVSGKISKSSRTLVIKILHPSVMS